MSDLILESREGDVVTLQFNDPEKLNAMRREMGLAFRDVVGRLALDDGIRAVVLTGVGRAFSAGGDLDMLQAQADAGAAAPGEAWRGIRDEMSSFYRLFLTVRDLPCPTIAALNHCFRCKIYKSPSRRTWPTSARFAAFPSMCIQEKRLASSVRVAVARASPTSP